MKFNNTDNEMQHCFSYELQVGEWNSLQISEQIHSTNGTGFFFVFIVTFLPFTFQRTIVVEG
jgi:hypothetical protein